MRSERVAKRRKVKERLIVFTFAVKVFLFHPYKYFLIEKKCFQRIIHNNIFTSNKKTAKHKSTVDSLPHWFSVVKRQ